MKARFAARYDTAGFTLIELIMVMTIMSIISVMIAVMVTHQMDGYVGLSRRAALVASGNALLSHLEDDIRNALPNSVRISGATLEMIPIQQTLRYREANSSAANSDSLDFSIADNRFQVLGSVASLPSGARLVIYNSSITTAGYNAYGGAATSGTYPAVGANVITPAATTLTVTTDASGDFITLSTGHQFSFASPQKRVYVVSSALSYRCDTSTGSIVRYRNYALQNSQPTTVAQFTALNATGAKIAGNVTACSFTFQPGSSQQTGLVTMKFKLENAGEKLEILHQIHVDNSN